MKNLDTKVISELFNPREPFIRDPNIAFMSTCLQNYGYDIQPIAYPNKQWSDTLKAFKSHFSKN
jgi:N-acetyl-anhydromuramyl-L-alanine amidase AmpD